MFLPLQSANGHGIEAGPTPAVEQFMDRPVVNGDIPTEPALNPPFHAATVIPPNTQTIDTSTMASHDDTETAGTPVPPTRQTDISGATRLKKMVHESSEMIVCPGVYDGFSARIALAVGFNAMYMVCLRPKVLYKHGWLIYTRLEPEQPLPASAWPTSGSPSSTTCASKPK